MGRRGKRKGGLLHDERGKGNEVLLELKTSCDVSFSTPLLLFLFPFIY